MARVSSFTLVCLLAASAVPAGASATVVRGRFRQTVLLTCELKAVRQSAITAPRGLVRNSSFTIAEIAEDGALVREGDVVLSFDESETAQLRLERETELISTMADIEVRKLEARAKVAELNVKIADGEARVRKAEIEVGLDPAVIPGSKMREARNELEVARSELAQRQTAVLTAEREADADVAMLESKARTAREARDGADGVLATFVIRSPQAGIAVRAKENDRALAVGAVVWAGRTALTVQDPGEMWADCDLDQADRQLAAVDQTVMVHADAHPDRGFAGRVRSISTFADPLTRGWWDKSAVRVFRLAVAITGTDPELLKPGLTARTDLLVRDEDGLLLPRASVQIDADGEFATTPAGERRALEIAARNATHALITSGVSEGETVRGAP